jgi:hypothetical protein
VEASVEAVIAFAAIFGVVTEPAANSLAPTTPADSAPALMFQIVPVHVHVRVPTVWVSPGDGEDGKFIAVIQALREFR